MSAPHTVYWHAEVGDTVAGELPELARDTAVDVMVVGGGFTGLSTAIHIKERHPELDVALFERRHPGWGASGRNTGYLTPLIGHDLHTTRKKLGDVLGKQVTAYGLEAVETVEGLIDRFEIDCHYEPTGLANPAVSTGQLRMADKLVAAADALGAPYARWSSDECSEKLGSGLFQGAFYQPTGGVLHPYRLLRGLLAAARGLGVQVYARSAVQNLELGSTVRATVNGHRVTAGHVVLGTNGYSEVPFTRRFYAPLHVYTVVSEPLTVQQLADIGWTSRTGVYTLHHILYALRLTHDDRIVAATGNVRYYWNNRRHVSDQPADYARLEKSISWLWPQLQGLGIDFRWEGVLAVTLSDFPAVGRHKRHPNVLYGMAYCGHGVSLANHTGRVLADLFDGAEERWEALPFVNQAPFPPVPGEPLRKAVATAYIGVLRALDWWQNRGLDAP